LIEQRKCLPLCSRIGIFLADQARNLILH